VADQGDDPQACGQAQDRGEDGYPHRDNGAKSKEQDEHGSRQADDLGDVGRWLGYLLPKITTGRRAQAGFLEWAVEFDDPLCLLDAELRGAVFQVEGDVADRMFLVELVSTLLAEWTDGMGDRRVLAIGFSDLFYGLLVFGIGELCTGRSPESDRDRAVGLVRELVAKQVAGRLAVGTRQREIVVRLLADAPGHNYYGECDHKSDRKDPHGVAGAKMTQTVEQGRQHDLLMTCGLYSSRHASVSRSGRPRTAYTPAMGRRIPQMG
jgi:hypothetical protein